MIDAIDRQMMADAIFSQDDNEIDLLCLNREYAISVGSIQTILTQEGDLEKRCIDPMALARLGRLQRAHRDRNLKNGADDFDYLVDGVTY